MINILCITLLDVFDLRRISIRSPWYGFLIMRDWTVGIPRFKKD
jgi:hypothetical protein